MKRLIFNLTFICLSLILFLGCSKSGEFKCGQKVVDADGNVYNTVKIGSQCWFRENLRVSKFNDGTAITTGLNNADWGSTSSGAYSFYEDVVSNNTPYGKLYNWYAVNSGSLCPDGWSIPTEEQFLELIDFLGGAEVANNKLKSKNLWEEGKNGNNQSGFNGLPGGYRSDSGNYFDKGKYGYYWTQTFYSSSEAIPFVLSKDGNIFSEVFSKRSGFSCRCIKD